MKNGRMWPMLIFIIFVFLFLFLDRSELKQKKVLQVVPAKTQTHPAKEVAKVLRVVDGDTIEVLIDGKEDTVRLIGIDSPELLDENKTAECFAKEASDKAQEMLSGKSVSLESDLTQNDRDEYWRLLRYVFLQNGTNFDLLMIEEGYAREYTFKGKAYKYRLEFIQAEAKARKEKKGLWLSGACD